MCNACAKHARNDAGGAGPHRPPAPREPPFRASRRSPAAAAAGDGGPAPRRLARFAAFEKRVPGAGGADQSVAGAPDAAKHRLGPEWSPAAARRWGPNSPHPRRAPNAGAPSHSLRLRDAFSRPSNAIPSHLGPGDADRRGSRNPLKILEILIRDPQIRAHEPPADSYPALDWQPSSQHRSIAASRPLRSEPTGPPQILIHTPQTRADVIPQRKMSPAEPCWPGRAARRRAKSSRTTSQASLRWLRKVQRTFPQRLRKLRFRWVAIQTVSKVVGGGFQKGRFRRVANQTVSKVVTGQSQKLVIQTGWRIRRGGESDGRGVEKAAKAANAAKAARRQLEGS
eukprot:gene17571-biopygen2565